MVVKFLGKKNVNFTNKEGEQIVGTSMYVAYKEEGVEGLCTDKFFIKGNQQLLTKDMSINDTLNVYFNNKHKIESITKA